MIICRIKNKPVSFFGTSFAIVQTDSMEPVIKVGDLIVFSECEYEDIKVGDYVVFVADENFSSEIRGQSVVHEVVQITDGGLITKGIHNYGNDGGFREETEVLGICTSHSTGWGVFFSFLSKYGILVLIAVIALPFIIKQIIKIVKLAKYGDDGGKQTDGQVVEKSVVPDGGSAGDINNKNSDDKTVEVSDDSFKNAGSENGEEISKDDEWE